MQTAYVARITGSSRLSSFVSRHLSLAICLSSFVSRHLSLVICLSSFVSRYSSLVIRLSLFVTSSAINLRQGTADKGLSPKLAK